MEKEYALGFLMRTAEAIAKMFGSGCETLIHDMTKPNHPIVAIFNGHVSGRQVGSEQDVFGTVETPTAEFSPDMVHARNLVIGYKDHINQMAMTALGRTVKSSTINLVGEGYHYALGINFDYTSLVYANRILVDLMSAEADLSAALWQGGDSALQELFDQCLTALGKPVDALTKADRLKVVALMDQKNAFSYRKSVPFVSKRLGVSRYTVYKYLDELGRQPKE